MKILLSTFLSLVIMFSVYADETEEILKDLCNAHGAPGFEAPVRERLKKYWNHQSISFEIDGMGNLVGKLPCNSQEGPKVLIMAHMDEVGFLITKVHNNGFISAIPLGGWVDHVIWAQKWCIQIGDLSIPAVSGMDPAHVLTDYTKSPTVSKAQFFLDTGLSKKELDDLGVRPGLPVTPSVEFEALKLGQRYIAKAFDDRAGLSIMIDLMKVLSKRDDIKQKCQIVFAATVQEELGMRGSKTVYESLNPNIVLNIEAGIARDYPVQFTSENEPVLGQGPAIFIFDGSMMPNQNLVSEIEKIAQKNDIPIQWEAEVSYGEDASCLQMSGRGIPAVNIGIPVRYAHSHYGVIDRKDYDNTVKLLTAIIENIDTQFVDKLP